MIAIAGDPGVRRPQSASTSYSLERRSVSGDVLPRGPEPEHLAGRGHADQRAHAAGGGLQVVLEVGALARAHGGAQREQAGRRVQRVTVLGAVAQAGVAARRVEVGHDRARAATAARARRR